MTNTNFGQKGIFRTRIDKQKLVTEIWTDAATGPPHTIETRYLESADVMVTELSRAPGGPAFNRTALRRKTGVRNDAWAPGAAPTGPPRRPTGRSIAAAGQAGRLAITDVNIIAVLTDGCAADLATGAMRRGAATDGAVGRGRRRQELGR